jgi:thiamine pyrophosphokinase
MNKGDIAAVLILAGDPPEGFAQEKLLELACRRPRPYIAAADGGALYLDALGIAPDIIIGDGDSLPKTLYPRVQRQSYPAAKDFTDGEAAYAYVLAQVTGKIAVFSAFGGRVDHYLANIFFPLHWEKAAERFLLIGNDCEAIYSRGYVEIQGKKGDLLSILPLTPQVKGITLSGVVYGLENYDLVVGSSRCVSNVLAGPLATVRHEKGLALIIHYI